MLCVLPGGLVDEAGTVHDEVELRGLSGREEELLAGDGGAETCAAALVTALLSRCVRRIGGIRQVDADVTRRLLVADRQFVLLKVREATFGERVQGSVPCPWPDCGRRVAVSFSTSDVPVRAARDKGPVHTAVLSADAMPGAGDADRTVAFRLPTGADQEALSGLLEENEAAALTGLLARCLLRVGPDTSVDEERVARLSPLARLEIERRMEEAAPRVDLLMEAECAHCGRAFSAPFDPQGFFFGELRATADLLRREVHYLAYHYHWSEREIMEMPRARRGRYIAVLADEIERSNECV
ncbi:hypothetical protein ABZ801_11455 [Actinomadura sp. NPDC047616]|uniref:T4 family baseplate hub assembly chaperone n=1 Tax=Actinomadura sp. NPDC047616 TaxID=3155914 RepID=UPI0033EE15DF